METQQDFASEVDNYVDQLDGYLKHADSLMNLLVELGDKLPEIDLKEIDGLIPELTKKLNKASKYVKRSEDEVVSLNRSLTGLLKLY